MKKTILVVDDSTSLRQIIVMTLQRAGYETIEAQDGVDGLAKLQASRVNLILTDVNMPNMDGITFVREVRKSSTARFVPIVILTTETQPEKMKEGQEAGAKAWLTKPFQPDQLLMVVSKVIGA